jgi:tRNA threonylcarbamoyladenosine biosynthesis protein TsaB
MIVLALDTSTPATAVGLRLEDGVTLTAHDRPGRGARPGHQARLLPLAAEVLRQAGIAWEQVDRIGVGVGPGTYTGLRVGIATARSLAQALGAEIVGVSSLEALAHGALCLSAGVPAGRASGAGAALAVLDARRGELFVAAYRRARAGEDASAPRAGGDAARGALTRVRAPRVLAADALELFVREALADAESPSVAASGPPAGGWTAVGDGAEARAAELGSLGVSVPERGSALHEIDGAAVCALAVDAPARQLADVVPDYCRRPDAEIALARRAQPIGAGA